MNLSSFPLPVMFVTPSISMSCVPGADVFTTVSQITAKEATLLHERAPEPVTPNGIDLEVIDAVAGASGRAQRSVGRESP